VLVGVRTIVVVRREVVASRDVVGGRVGMIGVNVVVGLAVVSGSRYCVPNEKDRWIVKVAEVVLGVDVVIGLDVVVGSSMIVLVTASVLNESVTRVVEGIEIDKVLELAVTMVVLWVVDDVEIGTMTGTLLELGTPVLTDVKLRLSGDDRILAAELEVVNIVSITVPVAAGVLLFVIVRVGKLKAVSVTEGVIVATVDTLVVVGDREIEREAADIEAANEELILSGTLDGVGVEADDLIASELVVIAKTVEEVPLTTSELCVLEKDAGEDVSIALVELTAAEADIEVGVASLDMLVSDTEERAVDVAASVLVVFPPIWKVSNVVDEAVIVSMVGTSIDTIVNELCPS
jgi:hypothetical protein